jgi:hypothetical protein
MEKSSRKINAKVFLQDFREGKTDEELMRLHSLSPTSLAKVVQVLLDKNLLDPAELKSRRAVAPTEPEIRLPIHDPQDFSRDEPGEEIKPREGEYRGSDFCPQCGAKVTDRMLSCPECGHVLPGQERWEAVEPKKGLTERIPARVWGYIIAIPIGVVLFFLFKDVILPMAESTSEKRNEALRQELPKGKTPLEASKDLAKQASSGIIRTEIERLTNEGILTGANKGYTSFTAGSRWVELSDGEKRTALEDIRTAMRRSGITTHFRLVNDSGDSLALVAGESIELYEESGPKETGDSAGEVGEQPAAPAVSPDILDRIPKYRKR